MTNKEQHPSTPESPQEIQSLVCWVNPKVGLKAGMLCPRCKKAIIEYNSLLQLVCPNCGLTEAGANT
jgi:predicted amidophosphoribosyltransferase